MLNKARILSVFGILLASIGLLFPAMFNGFPLVYSDTGTYIASGFQGIVPGDRPIAYGLFLRHSSLATSLWFSIFTQALLLSLLLYWFFSKVWSEPKTHLLAFLFTMLGLVLSSSISYFASLLMADVFAGISFFLLFLIIFDTPKRKWQIGVLALVYLFATATHLTYALSHLAMVTGMIFLKGLKVQFLSAISWRKWVFGSALVFLNFLFLPGIHFYNNGGFESSRNGHLYLTARMVESGAMKAVLDDNCSTKSYAICAFKDSLPSNGSDFLWLPESVLYKLGGWNEHADEYKELNKKIVFTAKYFVIYWRHFLRVAQFHIGEHKIGEELISFDLNTPPGWEIESNFREELPIFLGAKQARNFWNNKFNWINSWILIALILSLLAALVYLIWWPSDIYVKGLILSSFFLYLGNFLAVTISSSGSRYNARVDWIFVYIALVIILNKIGTLKRFANLK